MGIIGVVAALTLPNLNSSTSDKEKVVKLQKIYSDLNDAFGRAVAVYGPYSEWFVNDTTTDAQIKRIFDRITEFMKYSKVCSVSDSCSLFGDRDTNSGGIRAKHAVILADGTTLGFCDSDDTTTCSLKILKIYIDLDGPNKGPNVGGKDVFLLYIGGDNGIGYSNFYAKSSVSISKNTQDKSIATAWILENKNMDYLKCDGLKFNTNTTCK